MSTKFNRYLITTINCAIHGYFIFGVYSDRQTWDTWPLGGLLLLAFLMSTSYSKRFHGNWQDCLLISGMIAFLFYFSWLPLIILKYGNEWQLSLYINAIFSFIFVMLVQAQLKQQGQYFKIDKEVPDLTGERLTLCREVAKQAGLTPVAIKVATLGSFNALVQGFRRCIIIVDKRATESLLDDEFRALLAHECGHIRWGGVYPYLLVGPCLFFVTHVCILHYGWDLNFFQLMWCGLFLYFAISHTLEILCDRFGKVMVGAKCMDQMLVRVHNDIAKPMRQSIDNLWFCPFITHPPLAVRKAFLMNENKGIIGRYLSMWIIVGLILFHPTIWPLVCLWYLVFMLKYIQASRTCTLGLHGNIKKRNPLLRNTFIGCLSAIAVSLLLVKFFDSAIASIVMIALLFVVLALCIVGVFRGWFRSNHMSELSKNTQKKIIEMSVAIQEGRAEEALETVALISPKDKDKPWVVALTSTCLIHLDKLEEATTVLDKLNERAPDFLPSIHNRAVVECCLGRYDNAADIATRLGQHTGDPASLTLCAIFLWRSGRLGMAQQFVGKALDYKPEYGPAMGIAGVLDLELGCISPENAKKRIDLAAKLEPQDPLVMLAQMIWEARFGDTENAALQFTGIMKKIEKEQKLGWRHFYEAIRIELQLPDVNQENV